MKKPACSNCAVRICKCFFSYKKLVNTEEADQDTGNPVSHYWDRNQREAAPDDNYRDNNRDHLGFNRTPFNYPIPAREPELCAKFDEKFENRFQYPDRFVPEVDFSATCKHQNSFDPLDRNLIFHSEEAIIYSERKEEKLRIPVYVRGTGGQCSCVQQPDTHSSLLQNMGGGRFVCYTFLLCAVLNFLGGSLFGAQWTSRNQEFKTRGRETFLYLKTFTNSVVGFCSNMRFLATDWMCQPCGGGLDTPRYLVCDAKVLGPAKRHVQHLKELDSPRISL